MSKFIGLTLVLIILVAAFMVVIRPGTVAPVPLASPSPTLSPTASGLPDASVSPAISGSPFSSQFVTIASPLANEKVSSPLTVTGLARGGWYFEATFPVELVDAEGNILAKSYATAQGDWMTDSWVPFTAELRFDHDASVTSGKLILRKANASGLPERDDEVSIPVKL